MNKKDLIIEVQELAKKLERTPKKREFKKHNIAKRLFGTWNNFIKSAGLLPLKEYGLTKEKCAKYIHDFIKKNNRIPMMKDFDNDIYLPDSTSIINVFNLKWLEVLEELGYMPDKYYHLTEEDIYKLINDEIERIGSTKLIDYSEYKEDTSPSFTYIKKRLNKDWNEILEILGHETNHEPKTKEYWIEVLREISIKLGKTPSVIDLEQYGVNDGVFFYHFGSYNNAVKEAGLVPNWQPTAVKHADEELLEMYKELCKKLSRAATATDIDLNLPYKNDVFVTRFGGMNALKRLAGYNVPDRNKKYTKEEITKILINAYMTYGKLTNKEINILSKNNENFPSLNTILRYFKTTKMNEVWEEIMSKEINRR